MCEGSGDSGSGGGDVCDDNNFNSGVRKSEKDNITNSAFFVAGTDMGSDRICTGIKRELGIYTQLCDNAVFFTCAYGRNQGLDPSPRSG